ncbi:flagellar motor switch protein FliN [Planctomycetaceae bacterium SH139]
MPADQSGEESLGQDDIEALLRQAQSGVAEAAGEVADAEPSSSGSKPFELGELAAEEEEEHESQPLEILGDVELDLRIELGRTMMRLEEVLQLRGGAVVVLDKLAGDPVDIYANGRLIARGEVLVMNDNFCVRVTELVGSAAA